MKTDSVLFNDTIESPLGTISLVFDEHESLFAVGFLSEHSQMKKLLFKWKPRVSKAPRQSKVSDTLSAYFSGDLNCIDSLKVKFEGTPFQNSVWQALRKIPCGETRSYQQLANEIGNPKAVRAVGMANGANPVGIVVPCHRVIGSNGTLTGYAGGIERKRWLLKHEQQGLQLFQ